MVAPGPKGPSHAMGLFGHLLPFPGSSGALPQRRQRLWPALRYLGCFVALATTADAAATTDNSTVANCSAEPGSPNGARHPKGCAGAVWYNGGGSCRYCVGDAHFDNSWWRSCCEWIGDSCVTRPEPLREPWGSDFGCAYVGRRPSHVCAMELQTCNCHGRVLYGTGSSLSTPRDVDQSIECTNGAFCSDPALGEAKICWCYPFDDSVPPPSSDASESETSCIVSTIRVTGNTFAILLIEEAVVRFLADIVLRACLGTVHMTPYHAYHKGDASIDLDFVVPMVQDRVAVFCRLAQINASSCLRDAAVAAADEYEDATFQAIVREVDLSLCTPTISTCDTVTTTMEDPESSGSWLRAKFALLVFSAAMPFLSLAD